MHVAIYCPPDRYSVVSSSQPLQLTEDRQDFEDASNTQDMETYTLGVLGYIFGLGQ